MLKISTDDKYFQFVADKQFSMKHDPNMFLRECRCFTYITMCYEDDDIRLSAFAMDGRIDFCFAYAKDMETCDWYLLIDKLGIE